MRRNSPPVTLELETYPLTGRFLAGRLRHAMADAEKARLEAMVEGEEELEAERVVVRRGAAQEHCTLLVDGFALRMIQRDGHDYIVGVHVPGDFVDLHAFALKRIDHDVVSIGRVRVAHVPHAALARQMGEMPRLSRILWFASLLDASIHRTWIMKLEELKADRRLAHLFAEIWHRLEMVELARPDGFATPLTQTHLAVMCGISVVHANRALKQLRDSGVAQFRRGRLFSSDRAGLEAHGYFEPSYLYGRGVLQLHDEI
jgi:CRP-like cAMP-binding protein